MLPVAECDAAVEERRRVTDVVDRRTLLASDPQDAALERDLDLVAPEARHRQGQAIVVLVDLLDVVGREGGCLRVGAVKADVMTEELLRGTWYASMLLLN